MQNSSETTIKEIFTSIQGEGLYTGEKQIFVRFSKCNLNCKYCDTDFSSEKKYSVEDLYKNLKSNPCEVISFTGGEPLIEVDFLNEFLKKYKNKLNKKIYLETNGTLYGNLEEIIEYVDIVSMDIKLKSATGEENKFKDNEAFLKIANQKETFIKVVFDKNITKNEITSVIRLAKLNNNFIILQPKMPMDNDVDIIKIFDEFYGKYKNIRLIPQVHKFLNIL